MKSPLIFGENGPPSRQMAKNYELWNLFIIFVPGKIAKRRILSKFAGAHEALDSRNKGEVAEWSKAHAWKVCILQKGIAGSNPALSAPCF